MLKFLRRIKTFEKGHLIRQTPHDTCLKIAYYPPFDSAEDYTNHYYRACWYFPSTDQREVTVTLPLMSAVTLADIPDYFDGNIARYDCDHILGITVESDRLYHDAHVILLWQSVTDDAYKAIKSKFKNKRIYTVATHCVEANEFGNYASVLWDGLGYKRKQNILKKSEKIFRQHHNEKNQAAPINEAVIIGTGPSVDKVFNYDLKGRFIIGCNSVVKS